MHLDPRHATVSDGLKFGQTKRKIPKVSVRVRRWVIRELVWAIGSPTTPTDQTLGLDSIIEFESIIGVMLDFPDLVQHVESSMA
jgi:hypothetical protein